MVEVVTFSEFLKSFAEIGGFTGILPFVLTFFIFNFALAKMDFLEDHSQTGIAVILSLFVSWFLVQNPMYQGFIPGYFGRVAIGAIGFLGLAVLLAMAGFNIMDNKVPVFGVLAVIAAAGAFSISGGAYAFLPTKKIVAGLTLTDAYNFMFESGLFYLLIIGGFMYWAVAGASEGLDEEEDLNALDIINQAIGKDD